MSALNASLWRRVVIWIKRPDRVQVNTTSVYTSARVFSMLPERLSTDLTSLNPGEDRLAIVTEMVVDAEGVVTHSTVHRARVRNHAKLAYDAVAAWIEGEGDLPEAARAVPGMDEQLRTQDAVAQRMRARRRAAGSLDLETFQPRAVFDGDRVVDIRQQEQNRARQLIEEFMIATNTCTAQFLAQHGGSALRRVVRSPERWLRIVEVASKYGEALPKEPDSRALEGFLARQRKADPLRFPDLSLVIIKLMGSGEYVVEHARGEPIGHFGLAVRDYTHSTAPNRRYPDLVSLRMVKALLSGERAPYGMAELATLAEHCTHQEDAAQKVERSVRKSEAAVDLGLLTDEGRRELDGVAAVAHVEALLPAVHGDLVGALGRLAGQGGDGEAGGQAVVADVGHVLGTFQAVHGNLEVRRQRLHAARRRLRAPAGPARRCRRRRPRGARCRCSRGQIPACSPARRRP
jgi:exoribonuclease R